MPNSAATARVDSGRRLQTARISTSGIARRPGMWRDFVLAPAPMRPIFSMAGASSKGLGQVDLTTTARDRRGASFSPSPLYSGRGEKALTSCLQIDRPLEAFAERSLAPGAELAVGVGAEGQQRVEIRRGGQGAGAAVAHADVHE